MSDDSPTQVRLKPTPTAAAAARRRVAEACRGRLSQEATETARLLVSELVTNCVLHAHSTITLDIECSGNSLAVTVADEADAIPIVHDRVDTDARGGRGMWLVDTLAADWGVHPRPDGGKVVWFRLP